MVSIRPSLGWCRQSLGCGYLLKMSTFGAGECRIQIRLGAPGRRDQVSYKAEPNSARCLRSSADSCRVWAESRLPERCFCNCSAIVGQLRSLGVFTGGKFLDFVKQLAPNFLVTEFSVIKRPLQRRRHRNASPSSVQPFGPPPPHPPNIQARPSDDVRGPRTRQDASRKPHLKSSLSLPNLGADALDMEILQRVGVGNRRGGSSGCT